MSDPGPALPITSASLNRGADGAFLMFCDLATRLFNHEAVAVREAEPALDTTSRICKKLGHPLINLTGPAGFRSLLSRALKLARQEAPALATIQIKADGALERLGLEPELEHINPKDGIFLIAHLLSLLFLFIGEGLTLRLIQDAWPNETFTGGSPEGV